MARAALAYWSGRASVFAARAVQPLTTPKQSLFLSSWLGLLVMRRAREALRTPETQLSWRAHRAEGRRERRTPAAHRPPPARPARPTSCAVPLCVLPSRNARRPRALNSRAAHPASTARSAASSQTGMCGRPARAAHVDGGPACDGVPQHVPRARAAAPGGRPPRGQPGQARARAADGSSGGGVCCAPTSAACVAERRGAGAGSL